MQLKQYQTRVLDELGAFLDALARERDKLGGRLNHEDAFVREAAQNYDFVEKRWRQTISGLGYFPQTNGLGEKLPDVYLKVPTVGGKTLLACCAVGGVFS